MKDAPGRQIAAVWAAFIVVGLILGSIAGSMLRAAPFVRPEVPVVPSYRLSPALPSFSTPPPSAPPSPSPTVSEPPSASERSHDPPKVADPPPRRSLTAYKPWRTFNANVAAARRYALERLGRRQFSCLDILFDRESRWRVHAINRRSGAYGIPQALPGRKMAWAGSDWRDNATTQVRWALHYLAGRYGTACSGLAHSYRTGWY